MNTFIVYNFAVLLATTPSWVILVNLTCFACLYFWTWLDTLLQIQRYGFAMWPIHCPAVRVGSSGRQTGKDMFREGPVLGVHIQQGQWAHVVTLQQNTSCSYISQRALLRQSQQAKCSLHFPSQWLAVELFWFSIRILELFHFTPKVPPNFCFSVYKVKGGICHS